MKKSPVHPKYDMEHEGNGFDPQADFYQVR